MTHWLINGQGLAQTAWLGISICLAVASGMLLGSYFAGRRRSSTTRRFAASWGTAHGVPVSVAVLLLLADAWMFDGRMKAQDVAARNAAAESECLNKLDHEDSACFLL